MENNKQTNQRKRAPRFGVLDAVILLLIVAVVAGIYFRTHIMDWITNDVDWLTGQHHPASVRLAWHNG